MEIKKAFVRYSVEETLRRTINKEAKNIVSTSSCLENALFKKNEQFFKMVYGQREAKLKKLYSGAADTKDDTFASLRDQSRAL